jgi:hypothetical protein
MAKPLRIKEGSSRVKRSHSFGERPENKKGASSLADIATEARIISRQADHDGMLY